MKTILLKAFILFGTLMFLCAKCVMDPIKYDLHITNNSDRAVNVYIFLPWQGKPEDSIGIVYPDTSLYNANIDWFFTINAGRQYGYERSKRPIVEWVDNLPCDTVSIYFFSKDTVDAYPLETVQRDYKILVRYDLGVEDLISTYNKYGEPEIFYPPTEAMKNMKMYPPYEEIK